MEENKIDVYQIIGFLLLIAAIFWWFNVTIPDLEKSANVENQTNAQENQSEIIIEKDVLDLSDISSASNNEISNTIGLMDNQEIRVENKDVVFKFNSKGGSLTQVQLKGYSNYKEEPLFIVNDNQKINLNFQTKNGYDINTSDYNFEVEQFERGNVKIVIMKLLISEFQSIAFEYKIPENGYMIDFNIISKGLSSFINYDKKINFNWTLDAFRQAKSVDYENRYSQLLFQYDGDDTNYLSSYSDSDDSEDSVNWISYGQHFFNSILVFDSPIDNVEFTSTKLFELNADLHK